ncbi:MAG: PDZ domain-containing protein [Verrucomicrobiota bacterium]
MTIPIRRITLCFASIASSYLPGHAAEVDKVMELAKPAIVRIEVLMEEGVDGRMFKQHGFGSGSIIRADGYVLTNHHVAGRGTRFRCTLADREEIPATLVGTDALADLAIIKLDLSARLHPEAPLTVATFGDSAQLKVGDTVFALGSPAALSQSVTKGIVANTEMIAPKLMGGGLVLDGENVGELVRWIGHDAVIFGGNSGGPLVNSDGLIVGVNEVGIGSLGGAIPGNLAKEVAAQLIDKGAVVRGWIGLEVQELMRGDRQHHGVLVASVFPGSPAAKAGIKPGDLLQQLGATQLLDCRSPEDLPVFNALVLGSKVGSRISLAGQQDGKPAAWTVDVIARAPMQDFEAEFTPWGMTARGISPMGAIELKRDSTHGIQVHSVRPGGPAADAKPALNAQDVITHIDGKEIRSIDDFRGFNRSLPAEAKGPQSVLVAFERGLTHDKYLTVVKVGPEPKGQNPMTADRGWLGADVQVLGPELADALQLKGSSGVRITRIQADSPAAKGGLQAGDILIKIDGKVIATRRPEDVRVFSEGIAERGPDAVTAFEFIRDGKHQNASITLAASPADENDVAKCHDADFEFSARDLTDSFKDEKNIPRLLKAARVTDVTPNGWASLAGLLKDDLILTIDGAPIAGAASLEKVLATLKSAKQAQTVFFVQRGVRNLFLQLEPSWLADK